MFQESLLESCRARNPRRGWTPLLSLALQALALLMLVLLPLFQSQALPALRLVGTLEAPPPPPAAPPAPAPPSAHQQEVVSELADGHLLTPRKIPPQIAILNEAEPPLSPPGSLNGVDGGVPGSSGSGAIGVILSGLPTPVAPPPPPVERLIVSHMSPGSFIGWSRAIPFWPNEWASRARWCCAR